MIMVIVISIVLTEPACFRAKVLDFHAFQWWLGLDSILRSLSEVLQLLSGMSPKRPRKQIASRRILRHPATVGQTSAQRGQLEHVSSRFF